MKKVKVEICVCTSCVINGSVEIMESVESLKHLREQMEDGYAASPSGEIEITTSTCLSGKPHGEHSPMVKVNGQLLQKTDSESVMSTIIDCFRGEE